MSGIVKMHRKKGNRYFFIHYDFRPFVLGAVVVDMFWFKFAVAKARIAQLVEHNLAKVGVASSSLVSRSIKRASDIGSPFFSGMILRETDRLRRPECEKRWTRQHLSWRESNLPLLSLHSLVGHLTSKNATSVSSRQEMDTR